MRADIAEDIPLPEAIQRANAQFPDIQPLTAAEVIAAVKLIKLNHPDISAPVEKAYMRIVNEGVLPRGMYFDRIQGMETGTEHFDVDWKDLIFTALPTGTKDAEIGYGFSYRVRARLISSRPLTEQEKTTQRETRQLIEHAKALN